MRAALPWWTDDFLQTLRRTGEKSIAADFAGVTLRWVQISARQDRRLAHLIKEARLTWVAAEQRRRRDAARRKRYMARAS